MWGGATRQRGSIRRQPISSMPRAISASLSEVSAQRSTLGGSKGSHSLAISARCSLPSHVAFFFHTRGFRGALERRISHAEGTCFLFPPAVTVWGQSHVVPFFSAATAPHKPPSFAAMRLPAVVSSAHAASQSTCARQPGGSAALAAQTQEPTPTPDTPHRDPHAEHRPC